jgi:mRNA interferase YafQ
MYKIGFTGEFKNDLKRLKKRSAQNLEILHSFISILQNSGSSGIDRSFRPHKLSGKYSNHWECHVLNDLLLIWFQNDAEKTIILIRTGTHSDLFR